MAASATLFGKTAAGKFGLNERASHAIWPGMGMKIYKILTREQWDQARQTGMLKGAPVDLADGFIHFSTASQLAETARLYFVGMDDLILLGVDTERLGTSLKWEPSRGGDKFPHLYDVLRMDDVSLTIFLPLDDRGRHRFPPDIPQ
jgi:uncharacterized protein (DUF952 family)